MLLRVRQQVQWGRNQVLWMWVEAAWRGAEGRNTWPTLQCNDEGSEARAEQLWWEVKPKQTTRLRLEMFDVRRGQSE